MSEGDGRCSPISSSGLLDLQADPAAHLCAARNPTLVKDSLSRGHAAAPLRGGILDAAEAFVSPAALAAFHGTGTDREARLDVSIDVEVGVVRIEVRGRGQLDTLDALCREALADLLGCHIHGHPREGEGWSIQQTNTHTVLYSNCRLYVLLLSHSMCRDNSLHRDYRLALEHCPRANSRHQKAHPMDYSTAVQGRKKSQVRDLNLSCRKTSLVWWRKPCESLRGMVCNSLTDTPLDSSAPGNMYAPSP